MTPIIPKRLLATCEGVPERGVWLEHLPDAIHHLQSKWSLRLESPFDEGEGSCAWVAPAHGKGGTRAVLKLGMPHLEGEHEIAGLRFWQGEPTVHLLEADEGLNAMLLERCEPGTALRHRPELEQDMVLAGLLRRLWREPGDSHPFRPLCVMAAAWAEETRLNPQRCPDVGLLHEGLRLLEELSRPPSDDVLLATDLHAGNVLQAQREPWLVIDPKPFVGDRAYDATQHLLNCQPRMRADPGTTIARFADMLEVDAQRVRLWMFARCVTGMRKLWDDEAIALVKRLVKAPPQPH